MPSETQGADSDLFFFDWLAYLQSEDYQDWVDLEITRREYERNPQSFVALRGGDDE
jgi:hypothetical protein